MSHEADLGQSFFPGRNRNEYAAYLRNLIPLCTRLQRIANLRNGQNVRYLGHLFVPQKSVLSRPLARILDIQVE